jgi:hypothetical protein
VSTSPDQQGSKHDYGKAPASEMEAVAEQLVSLVEEFESALREGHVPRAFADRLAKLRNTADRLI